MVAYLAFNESGASVYEILPTTVTYGGKATTFTFTHTDRNVTLYANNNDGTATAKPGKLTLKVVSIPAGSLTIKSNVNLKDYNAVKAAFNIQD